MSKGRESKKAETAPGLVFTLWSLVLVVAVALLPRFQRISQSWVDVCEYLTMIQPPENSLLGYLERLYGVGPDQVPGYYIFTYFTRHVFGYSWLVTRYASLALCMGALLLAWRFAGRRWGVWAALCTGLFIALSPADVYHASEARAYALMILLGTVSFGALARAHETGGRLWWALNVVANTLATWTNLFGILLIGAQGLWVLLRGFVLQGEGRTTLQRVWPAARAGLIYGAGHILAFGLAATWLLGSASEKVNWYAPAPLGQFLTDLMGDALYHQNLFVFESAAGAPVFQFAALAIRGNGEYWLSYAADGLLLAGMLLGLGSFVWHTMVRERDTGRRLIPALLLLCTFAPPLVIYLAAWLTFPMALPRYTAYTNIPFWVMVGTGIALLPLRRMWVVVPVVVMGCLAVECVIWARVQPEVNWPGIIALADRERQVAPERVCLAFGTTLGRLSAKQKRILEYHDPDKAARYVQAYTIDGAVDACAAIALKSKRPVQLITYELPPTPEKRQALAEALRGAGFAFGAQGLGHFTLYTVSNPSPTERWKLPPNENARRYGETLRAFAQGVPEDEFNATLRWCIESDMDLESPAIRGTLPYVMLEISPRMARAALQSVAAQGGMLDPVPRLLVAVALGEPAEAAEAGSVVKAPLGEAYKTPLYAALASGNLPHAREIALGLHGAGGTLLFPAESQVAGAETRLPFAAALAGARP